MSSALSAALLAQLAHELSHENTVAVVLGGSEARGDATAWSDVDLLHLVAVPPANPDRVYRYAAGRLLSVATRTLDWYRTALSVPERAIFIVPAIREARPLHDPSGTFQGFQRELERFAWEPLRPAAQRFVSQNLVNGAEAAHKLLSAELRNDHATAFAASVGLFFDLTLAVVVGHGRLIDGQLPYLAHAQEAAGRETAWTQLHRQFVALDTLPAAEAFRGTRSTLALQLYAETARLMRATLLSEQAAVVSETVRLLRNVEREA